MPLVPRLLQKLFFGIALSTLASPTVPAQNWPQWRGPLGHGVAADGDYPVEFSSDEECGLESRAARASAVRRRPCGAMRSLSRAASTARTASCATAWMATSVGGKRSARAARQASQRQRQQSIARDRRQARRRVFQERHGGLLRHGRPRSCGKPICRKNMAKTRCGGTWARRRSWPTDA